MALPPFYSSMVTVSFKNLKNFSETTVECATEAMDGSAPIASEAGFVFDLRDR